MTISVSFNGSSFKVRVEEFDPFPLDGSSFEFLVSKYENIGLKSDRHQNSNHSEYANQSEYGESFEKS